MEIKHLKVSNFRGIKELDWYLPGKYICLIGPGDSAKTTILDAIEYALYPSYTISFDDTDFFNCDIEQSIEIYVSITNYPEEFQEDSKFGMYQRGIEDNVLVDETEGENIFRKELWNDLRKLFKTYSLSTNESLKKLARKQVELDSIKGRYIYSKTISRPPLIKGLEFNHAILLDADKLKPKELYVSLTRGSNYLTILSKDKVLNPYG